MSASREKNKRKEERTNGVDKRKQRAEDAAAAKKRSKLIGTVAGIAAVVVLCLLILFNSTLLYTGVAAVKVGDWRFNNAQFNYEYFTECYSTYNNIYDTYGEYASYLLDLSKPLDEQTYADNMTWEQYFEDAAIDRLTQIAALWDAGHAEGFEAGRDLDASVEEAVDSIRSNAVRGGFPSLRQYLGQVYGKGFNEKILRDMLEKTNYTAEYSLKLIDGWKEGFTAEELDEYYQGVADNYDMLKYGMFYVSGAAETGEDGEAADEAAAEAAMKAAKETAEKVAQATDENGFYFNVLTNCGQDESGVYADPSSVFKTTTPAGLGVEEWTQWFTDPARQYGDTTVFETADGCYAMMFVSLDHNDYNMENFRVIRLDVEPDEDGALTQEQRDAKRAEADDVYARFTAEATAEQFEALAAEYSKDTASLAAGGRYTAMTRGMFGNDDVDAYVFAPERAEGDHTVIESGDSFYIILIDAEGDNYKDYIAGELLASDTYNAMLDTLAEDYPVTTTAAFRLSK